MAITVFSHFILDFLVHVPEMPVYRTRFTPFRIRLVEPSATRPRTGEFDCFDRNLSLAARFEANLLVSVILGAIDGARHCNDRGGTVAADFTARAYPDGRFIDSPLSYC